MHFAQKPSLHTVFANFRLLISYLTPSHSTSPNRVSADPTLSSHTTSPPRLPSSQPCLSACPHNGRPALRAGARPSALVGAARRCPYCGPSRSIMGRRRRSRPTGAMFGPLCGDVPRPASHPCRRATRPWTRASIGRKNSANRGCAHEMMDE